MLFNQKTIETCFETGKPYGDTVTIRKQRHNICRYYSTGTKNREGVYLCLALSTDTIKVPEEDKKTLDLVTKKYFLCCRKCEEEK